MQHMVMTVCTVAHGCCQVQPGVIQHKNRDAQPSILCMSLLCHSVHTCHSGDWLQCGAWVQGWHVVLASPTNHCVGPHHVMVFMVKVVAVEHVAATVSTKPAGREAAGQYLFCCLCTVPQENGDCSI